MLRERKEDAAIIADTFRTAEQSVLTGAAAIAMCAAKMLELHAAYADLTEIGEGQALVTRRGRMLLAIEAEQLHAEFRRLFHTEVDGDNPRPAA